MVCTGLFVTTAAGAAGTAVVVAAVTVVVPAARLNVAAPLGYCAADRCWSTPSTLTASTYRFRSVSEPPPQASFRNCTPTLWVLPLKVPATSTSCSLPEPCSALAICTPPTCCPSTKTTNCASPFQASSDTDNWIVSGPDPTVTVDPAATGVAATLKFAVPLLYSACDCPVDTPSTRTSLTYRLRSIADVPP